MTGRPRSWVSKLRISHVHILRYHTRHRITMLIRGPHFLIAPLILRPVACSGVDDVGGRNDIVPAWLAHGPWISRIPGEHLPWQRQSARHLEEIAAELETTISYGRLCITSTTQEQ